MGEFLEDYAGEISNGIFKMIWKDVGLRNGLNKGPDRLNSEMDLILESYAPRIESWMKDNASWTDRTGNARNGLAARAYSSGGERGIVLYHQVPYGIFLEVRFSGKYGIIVPALEEWGPRVMRGTKNIMGSI